MHYYSLHATATAYFSESLLKKMLGGGLGGSALEISESNFPRICSFCPPITTVLLTDSTAVVIIILYGQAKLRCIWWALLTSIDTTFEELL